MSAMDRCHKIAGRLAVADEMEFYLAVQFGGERIFRLTRNFVDQLVNVLERPLFAGEDVAADGDGIGKVDQLVAWNNLDPVFV